MRYAFLLGADFFRSLFTPRSARDACLNTSWAILPRRISYGCRVLGKEKAQGLKPRSSWGFNGPTKQAAEKVRTGQESNTSGAKARRILNRLRPD
jgi:hypothetical protein